MKADTLEVCGVAVALCCHHRCDWRHYVGREFFQERGLGAAEFGAFQRMSSWATCGMSKAAGHRDAAAAGTTGTTGRDAADEEDEHEDVGDAVPEGLDRSAVDCTHFVTVAQTPDQWEAN